MNTIEQRDRARLLAAAVEVPLPRRAEAPERVGAALRLAALARDAAAARLRSVSFGTYLTAVSSLAAFLAAFEIVAQSRHAPLDISSGLLVQLLATSAPLVAGAVAALAVASPWRGYLAVLLLAPYFDASQIAWQFGPLQVISQTILLAALCLGVVLRTVREREAGAPHAGSTSLRRALTAPVRHPALGAALGLLAVAIVSTVASPDPKNSLQVLAHGLVEPIAMGLLLFAMRIDRRRIALLALALGLSVALGGILNLIQSIPELRSAAVFHAQRIYFARLTYFNIGQFGEVLAMAVPLLGGALLARQTIGLGRRATRIVGASLVVCVFFLLMTLEKSAWLAGAAGALVLLLLLVRPWRARFAIMLASAVLLSVVVPWPAYLLRGVTPAIADLDRQVTISLVGQGRFDSWNPATVAGRHSLVERYLVMQSAVRMGLNHPLLGVGLDRFKASYLAGYRSPLATLVLDSAHALWPEVAAELGLVALGLLVAIFLAALWAAWRTFRSPPDESTRQLAAALLAALAAWLVVATAFAGDMYRPWRHMASDFVMAAVITAAALALPRVAAAARGRGEVERTGPSA